MKKTVVGVKFRDSGKTFYFEPGNIDLIKGDSVIVQTNNGDEFGDVVLGPVMIPEEKLKEIFPIIRKATSDDIDFHKTLVQQAEEAKEIFNKEAAKHKLDMKLIDVVFTFDTKKIIFYYTADGRVDFRDLVRDLAGYFHARIELRQIGVRDEARKFNSVGVCGHKCCCSSWLSDFIPVTIKMAKEQNLSLNSTKISGVCGRLLCCLKYEQDYYQEVSKKMPHIGDELKTPVGKGTVYKLNTLDQAVLMKVTNDRDEVEIRRFTLEELDKAAKEPEHEYVPMGRTIIPQEVEKPANEDSKIEIKRTYANKKRKRQRPRKRNAPRIDKSKTQKKSAVGSKKTETRKEKASDNKKPKPRKTTKTQNTKKVKVRNRPNKRYSDSSKKTSKPARRSSTPRKNKSRRRPPSKMNSK